MQVFRLNESVSVRLRKSVAIFGLSCGFLFVVPIHLVLAATAPSGPDVVTPQLEVQIPGVDLSTGQVSEQNGSIQESYLATYTSGVYQFLLGIVVITAAVMIIYGGFKYIIAATGADIQDGKDRIRDAIIGLVLVFGSYTLLKVMNPALTTFKPLKVDTVDLQYFSAVTNGDEPPSQYARAAAEASVGVGAGVGGVGEGSAGVGAGVGGGGDVGVGAGVGGGSGGGGGSAQNGPSGVDFSLNKNQGCGPNGYKEVKALCTSVQDCYNKYCIPQVRTDPKPVGMIETEKTLVTFKDLPVDQKQQIEQFGLKFMLKPQNMTATQEAHDALLKAGKIAKEKGYFLSVTDAGRPMEYQVKFFCERTAQSIAKGDNPPKSGGMGLPGSSNHGLGIAVDVLLKKMVDGKEKQLTPGGPVCGENNLNQVDNAVVFGIQNIPILQAIMAEAGWKNLCSEIWHFDYKGVYESDCFRCAFPPSPPHGSMKGCTPRYRPPAN